MKLIYFRTLRITFKGSLSPFSSPSFKGQQEQSFEGGRLPEDGQRSEDGQPDEYEQLPQPPFPVKILLIFQIRMIAAAKSIP